MKRRTLLILGTGLLPAMGQEPPPLDLSKMVLPEPANPTLPTLWLVGDSTVRNGRADGANGQWGWGEPLAELLDPAQVNVCNRAIGGTSSRTYRTSGHWAKTLGLMKPGDVLLIQFGHNDGGALNDRSRARGTLAGTGAECVDIRNLLTGKHETVCTYGAYLRRYVAEARDAGVRAGLCSPVPRKQWKDGRVLRLGETYALWARQVSAELGVPFVDLNERIALRYEALGEQEVEKLFADPHTHTSRAGAELNARVVVDALAELRPPLIANNWIKSPKR
jgi:lysophospholipase L1-like esterase